MWFIIALSVLLAIGVGAVSIISLLAFLRELLGILSNNLFAVAVLIMGWILIRKRK